MIPKIVLPMKAIRIPSLNKDVMFSPYTVSVEKALLTLDNDASVFEKTSLMKNIIKSCCNDDKINIDKINIYELSFIFLHLRKISVSNNILLYRVCDKCNNKNIVNINIDNIKYDEDKQKIQKYNIDTDLGKYIIEVGFPTVDDFSNISLNNDDADLKFVSRHIKRYYSVDGNDEVDLNDDVKLELLLNLPVDIGQKIAEYAKNVPSAYYELDEVCEACGEIYKETVTDFFG